MKRTLIRNLRIVDGGEIRAGSLLLADGIVEAVLPPETQIPDAALIEGENAYAAAGFIDLHAHGGAEYDFMDRSTEAFRACCELQLRHGVTTLLPTTSTDSFEALRGVLDRLRIVRAEMCGRQCLPGIHIEGQYISMARNGGMDGRYIKNPDEAEYRALIEYAVGDIARWSAAPELPGGMAFGDCCAANGIVASIAHSDATYDEVAEAMRHGYTHLTHFYSDMNSITRPNGFRTMGAIEAGYDFDGFWIEIIADGCHIPPALMRHIYRHIGAQRMHFVSDSIRPSGQDGPLVNVGSYDRELIGLLEDGVVKFTDRSAFHGSIAQGDMLLRAAAQTCGLPLADCVRMLSENPAKVIGLGGRKGRLLPGYDADLVLLGEQLNIQKVFCCGKQIPIDHN